MKKSLLLLLFIVSAFSCDAPYRSPIPYAPVNLSLDLRTTDSELNAKYAYKTIFEPRYASERIGFGGILIINGFGENSVDLYAYDLACPVEVQRSVRIVPDEKTGMTAACPKCGAVFDIANGNGTPRSGAKLYLKSYQVIRNGSEWEYLIRN
jgi:nitrite reductase/ring-hydroxylating ferredoxin subunit